MEKKCIHLQAGINYIIMPRCRCIQLNRTFVLKVGITNVIVTVEGIIQEVAKRLGNRWRTITVSCSSGQSPTIFLPGITYRHTTHKRTLATFHTWKKYFQGVVAFIAVNTLLLPRAFCRQMDTMRIRQTDIIRQRQTAVESTHIRPRKHVHGFGPLNIHGHISKKGIVIAIKIKLILMFTP